MLIAKIRGNAKSYKNDGRFIIILEVEYNNKNTSKLAYYNATISQDKEESNFLCGFGKFDKQILQVEIIYLLTYNYVTDNDLPFEIFIEKEIKVQDGKIPGQEPEPLASSFLIILKFL